MLKLIVCSALLLPAFVACKKANNASDQAAVRLMPDPNIPQGSKLCKFSGRSMTGVMVEESPTGKPKVYWFEETRGAEIPYLQDINEGGDARPVGYVYRDPQATTGGYVSVYNDGRVLFGDDGQKYEAMTCSN